MNTKNLNKERGKAARQEEATAEDTTNLQENQPNTTEEAEGTDIVTDEGESLQKKYDVLNDSHLRLMAEFDNYRKRTLREKAELIKTGGESVLSGLLSVVDDFERAVQNIRTADDLTAVGEGVELIFGKFNSFLAQQGVKPIETIGKAFDMETSEAVATIPAPQEDLKGKVIDCVQTGYKLHEKVIRHAKVVVGE